MKKIKYIISGLLIAAVFGIIGELYVWHMENFESAYTYVTMYSQKNVSQEEMVEDIYNAAAKTNVEVFTVSREVENIFSSKTTIYGTKGVESYLHHNSNIDEGEFQSIFLGNVSVEFKDLDEIEDISQMEVYQVIGEADNITEFKVDLVNKYAGKFPQLGYVDHENLFIIVAIWGISLGLILLMTLYEVALMKKEVMVRAICGESIINFIIKNIIVDGLVYLSIFMAIALSMRRITTITYYFPISLFAIIIFLILNSLLYTFLYFTDYKKDMGSKESSKKVLNLSYVYKVLSIILVISSMFGCIELIYQGITYYRQKSFFEERKDYSYLSLTTTQDDDSVYTDIYRQLSQKGNVISLIKLDTMVNNETNGVGYVLGNSGAIDYLKSNIYEMKNLSFEEKIYFVIPEKYKDNQDVYTELEDIWTSYYIGDYDYEFIFYKGIVNIMSINNFGKVSTGFLENPVIIFNNISDYDRYWNMLQIFTSSLFKISNEELEKIISDYGLENEVYYRTNIYEHYLYKWQTVERNMVIGIVLFVVLLTLESTIISVIISYEYRVSAMELSLMKVLGYKVFERYRKLWITTFISASLSLMITTIVFCLMGYSLKYIMIGGISLIFIELVIMSYYIHRADQVNIQKVLKGGTL